MMNGYKKNDLVYINLMGIPVPCKIVDPAPTAYDDYVEVEPLNPGENAMVQLSLVTPMGGE